MVRELVPTFTTGDVILVPAGVSHNPTNVGKATAKVLAT